MLLAAFCVLILQSQLAIASHSCDLNPLGDSSVLQHVNHQQMSSMTMKTSLCEKHCVPESASQTPDHPPVLALPTTVSLAVVNPPCERAVTTNRTFTPPAIGPPATIRFCRFRE